MYVCNYFDILQIVPMRRLWRFKLSCANVVGMSNSPGSFGMFVETKIKQ